MDILWQVYFNPVVFTGYDTASDALNGQSSGYRIELNFTSMIQSKTHCSDAGAVTVRSM